MRADRRTSTDMHVTILRMHPARGEGQIAGLEKVWWCRYRRRSDHWPRRRYRANISSSSRIIIINSATMTSRSKMTTTNCATAEHWTTSTTRRPATSTCPCRGRSCPTVAASRRRARPPRSRRPTWRRSAGLTAALPSMPSSPAASQGRF